MARGTPRACGFSIFIQTLTVQRTLRPPFGCFIMLRRFTIATRSLERCLKDWFVAATRLNRNINS